jgi:hypothetical protein
MKRRRSVIAVLSVGIIGVLAIGASSASAQNGTVPFKAFMNSGTSATLTGVPGAAAVANCDTASRLANNGGSDPGVVVVGTKPGGIIKTLFSEEGTQPDPSSFAFQDDNFNINDVAPLNLAGGPVGREVSGTFEFANGDQTRQLTAQYATEDGGSTGNTGADCAVWGSAVKVIAD